MLEKSKLEQLFGAENVRVNESLAKHTTFRIGGPADYLLAPDSVEEFVEMVAYLKKEQTDFLVIGNGSNLLVRDEGYAGVVLSTHVSGKVYSCQKGKMPLDMWEIFENTPEQWQGIFEKYPSVSPSVKENMNTDSTMVEKEKLVLAGSGILLSTLANAIGKAGLDGFAFASGIPGTLGGAVTMNAGAYGGEIKDVLLGAMVLEKDGTPKFYGKEELQLGYRSSIIQKNEMYVLWALFSFPEGDVDQIQETMRDLNARRREKQPLEYGSAGSTFKRPEGYFAGKLIEDAGLKGYRSGDVMVSEKHCGFVVNVGEGTYEDAMKVIEHVQNTVRERFGVSLELEVKTI